MSYVALLRGINLGKLNKVDMKSLKQLFEQLGFEQVQTYIQSGNVLFNSLILDEQQLEEKLQQTYHFEIPVIVRSKDELLAAIQHPIAEKENVYFLFLKKKMTEQQHNDLKEIVTEQFTVLNDDTIVINLGDNYHKSKFTNAFFERKLLITSTARNKNTVKKILQKMD
jgi:uncharacterized protein (DUF1697 family)